MNEGLSEVLSCRNISAANAMEGARLLLMPWYTRVPSASNVTDNSARLKSDFGVPGFEMEKREAFRPKSLSGGTWRAD